MAAHIDDGLGIVVRGQLRFIENALQQGQPQREKARVGRSHDEGVRADAGRARNEGKQGQLLGLQPVKGLLAQRLEGLPVFVLETGLSVGWLSAITMQSGSRRRM
jgi:hypothetical protein